MPGDSRGVAPGASALETPPSCPALLGLLDAPSDDLRRLVKEVARLADLGRALEAWTLLAPVIDREIAGGLPALRVTALLEAVRVLVQLGRGREALPRALRALSLAEHHGLVETTAVALQKLGYVHHRLGDLAAARNAYEEAYARFRRLGDEASTASARNNLALVLKNLGEWDAAESHLVAALEHARRTDRTALAGSRALNLAVLRLKRGDAAGAAGPLDEARAGAARSGHVWTRATSSLAAGWRARLQRKFGEAERFLHQALELAQSECLRREETIALEFLADVSGDRGQVVVASRLLAQAFQLVGRVEDAPDLGCEILHRLAASDLARGRHAQAREALDRSAALAKELGDPYEQARIAIVEADMARSEGRTDTETAWLGRAAALLEALGEWRERARTLARLAAADRDPVQSRGLAMEARHLAHRAGDMPTIARLDAREIPAPRPAKGRHTAAPTPCVRQLVGACPSIARARDLITVAAASGEPVLVVGESGTGKDHVARAIHAAAGGTDPNFIVVDAADTAESGFRTSLQAAARQARRVAPAPVTLYVDRLDELSADDQRTLLKRLENAAAADAGGGGGPRIVASATPALGDLVDRGGFRSELFHRLQATLVALPPLRKRGEDVVLLAEALLGELAAADAHLDADARHALLRHYWPGNVRELQQVLKLAAALFPGGDPAALSAIVQDQLRRVAESPGPVGARSGSAASAGSIDQFVLRQQLLDLERDEIAEALKRASGNRSSAARLLRVSRKTLYARMRRLGIAPPPPAN